LIELVSELAAGLEASQLGRSMRSSAGLYPAVNVAHLAGLVLLVGAIGVLDLRVAGLARAVPLAPLSRFLTPFAAVGLVVVAASGFLLFAADAGPLVRSGVFRLKLALAAVAVLNALAFRLRYGDLPGEAPPLARLMAAASIGLWLTVACLGRLIAYS
jgi:hypothetical protein